MYRVQVPQGVEPYGWMTRPTSIRVMCRRPGSRGRICRCRMVPSPHVVIDRVYRPGTTMSNRVAHLRGRDLADLHRPVQTGFDVKLVGAGIGLRRHENLAWLALLLSLKRRGSLPK